MENNSNKEKDIEFSLRFTNETKKNNKNNNAKILTKIKIPAFDYIKTEFEIKLNANGDIGFDLFSNMFKFFGSLFLPEEITMYEKIGRNIIRNNYKKIMIVLRPFILKVYDNPSYMKELLLKIFNKENYELFTRRLNSKDIIFKTQSQSINYKNPSDVETKLSTLVNELCDLFIYILKKVKNEEKEEKEIPPKIKEYTKVNINDIVEFIRLIVNKYFLIFPRQPIQLIA